MHVSFFPHFFLIKKQLRATCLNSEVDFYCRIMFLAIRERKGTKMMRREKKAWRGEEKNRRRLRGLGSVVWRDSPTAKSRAKKQFPCPASHRSRGTHCAREWGPPRPSSSSFFRSSDRVGLPLSSRSPPPSVLTPYYLPLRGPVLRAVRGLPPRSSSSSPPFSLSSFLLDQLATCGVTLYKSTRPATLFLVPSLPRVEAFCC